MLGRVKLRPLSLSFFFFFSCPTSTTSFDSNSATGVGVGCSFFFSEVGIVAEVVVDLAIEEAELRSIGGGAVLGAVQRAGG